MENYYYQNIALLNLCYKNQCKTYPLPEGFFSIKFLQKLFSPETLSKVINEQNSLKLMKYLPKSEQKTIFSPDKLSELLLNKISKFRTPIEDFYQKYCHLFFTQKYQSNLGLFKISNISDYTEKKKFIFLELQNKLKNLESQQNNTITNNNNNNINSSFNPNIIKNTHSNQNDNENLVTFDMHSELASSGYTSLNDDKDSHNNSNSRKNSGDMDENKESNLNMNNNNVEDGTKYSKNLSKSNQKSKQLSHGTNSYMENSDDASFFIDRNILKSDRFKNVRKNKVQITIKPRTKEEVEDFRKQEKLRYEKPYLPWEYTLSNGNVAIVAPLCSNSKNSIAKARDHELLKAERPPFITLLALVRDAASRLEDGVGTRMDICELLKDSQYINEDVPDGKINNIVSGALDRLHYQKDPCVKYDSHNKLWIYLHRNRSVDYPGWKRANKEQKFEKVNEDNNKIVIEEDTDKDIEEVNEIKKDEKIDEVIEVGGDEKQDPVIDVQNFDDKNICVIKNESSSDIQNNLIELNEQMYNKNIKSSLMGKKRGKK